MNKKHHQAGKKEAMTEQKKHDNPQSETNETVAESPNQPDEVQTLQEEIAKWKDATLRGACRYGKLKKTRGN